LCCAHLVAEHLVPFIVSKLPHTFPYRPGFSWIRWTQHRRTVRMRSIGVLVPPTVLSVRQTVRFCAVSYVPPSCGEVDSIALSTFIALLLFVRNIPLSGDSPAVPVFTHPTNLFSCAFTCLRARHMRAHRMRRCQHVPISTVTRSSTTRPGSLRSVCRHRPTTQVVVVASENLSPRHEQTSERARTGHANVSCRGTGRHQRRRSKRRQ